MRTVSTESVLSGVLRREGGANLALEDASAGEIATFLDYIADRLRTAWEYYAWPEAYVTERRRFRAEWDAGTTYAAGAEVWFEDSEGSGAYYAAAAAPDTPAAGESPETDADKWTELETLRAFVAFDQAGETEFEACVGAWTSDPESDKGALKVKYQVTADGILIKPGQGLDQVWLRVRRVCPDLAAVLWDEAATYAAGRRIFFRDTGEVYRVLELTEATESPATDEEKFELVPFPMIFARAVKAGALADWQRSDGGGSAVKTRDSEDRFIELLDEQVWQLTKLQGQTGRYDVEPGP